MKALQLGTFLLSEVFSLSQILIKIKGFNVVGALSHMRL